MQSGATICCRFRGWNKFRMVHVITYDLVEGNDTPENYSRIIDGIKDLFPTWCHVEKSVWVVKSELGPGEIREALKSFLRAGDRLFVATLNGRWSSGTSATIAIIGCTAEKVTFSYGAPCTAISCSGAIGCTTPSG